MRDLQTSGIVGLSASKVGYRHSDRHGEVNDKKNVAVLPTVPASIRATKGSTGGYTYQGNKVVLASPLVITGVMKSASASLVMPAINFSCLCPD
ncbi:hypothetical protein FORC44_0261 [Escherichia coli]|nr:hypothetical protein FORC44_0261 [Escherichia coli]VTQ20013.1 Uncharacterised protein [Escherichia coli]